MKVLCALLIFVVTINAQAIDKLAFYFGIPKANLGSVPAFPSCDNPAYPIIWNPSAQSPDVGLRVVAIEEPPGLAGAKSSRRQMAKDLAGKLLQDGDVVLTFRPELADTMAYPHIQMGITHAGLVYTEPVSGHAHVAAFNIDSPMDSIYMGQFDTAHYAGDGASDGGTDALHVIRPRGFSEERKRRLNNWIRTLKTNLGRINGNRQQVKFQPDYMAPTFLAQQKTTRQTVTQLGQIILEIDRTSKEPMFCSEFAWHMLALSGCTFDEIRRAGPEGASCVAPLFDPMPMVSPKSGVYGLGEGPLVDLIAMKGNAANLASIFAEGGNSGGLSSGHRAVAALVAPMMPGLQQLYGARLQGAPSEAIAGPAGELNAAVPPNYSPTAFFIQSLSGRGPMEYVATLAWVPRATFQKVQQEAGCRTSAGVLPPRVSTTPEVCLAEAAAFREAQRSLISSGHLNRGGDDGLWGPRSQAALNKYQRDFNQKITNCLTREAHQGLGRRR